MKTLPIFKGLKYNQKSHSRYYKLMPARMTKYEDLLTSLGAEILFEAEEEDMPVQGNFEDEETEQSIINEYENGNHYAWFCAKVTVKFRGFESTDYLGGCSYKSAKDFKNGGYYWDMVNTCVKEINSDIERQNKETTKFWNIRKAKNLIAPYNLFIVASKELHTL